MYLNVDTGFPDGICWRRRTLRRADVWGTSAWIIQIGGTLRRLVLVPRHYRGSQNGPRNYVSALTSRPADLLLPRATSRPKKCLFDLSMSYFSRNLRPNIKSLPKSLYSPSRLKWNVRLKIKSPHENFARSLYLSTHKINGGIYFLEVKCL